MGVIIVLLPRWFESRKRPAAQMDAAAADDNDDSQDQEDQARHGREPSAGRAILSTIETASNLSAATSITTTITTVNATQDKAQSGPEGAPAKLANGISLDGRRSIADARSIERLRAKLDKRLKSSRRGQ